MVPNPKVIQHVEQIAKKWIPSSHILLFGSQARQDQSASSDFDIAVQLNPKDAENWSFFCQDLRDFSPTFHTFDIIDFDKVGDQLQKRILAEGKSIYGKKI